MDDNEIRMRLGGEYAPAKTHVKFSVGAIQKHEEPEETEKRGYPLFIECDMVSKHVDGERDFVSSFVDLEVEPKMYPKEWAAFIEAKGKPAPIPLTALPKMNAAIFATLKALDIHTVNDLLEKDIPEGVAEYKTYAQHLKRLHDFAVTGIKPRLKL